MDVYHKVLTKLYEITDGKDSVNVDFAELLKKEGFFPSIDDIKSYLSGESWIAETNRVNVVRITHWGVAEAKRSLAGAPDPSQVIGKETARLVKVLKETLVMAEELTSSPSEDKVNVIGSRVSEMTNVLNRIKDNL
ncbi:MAG: hypothetical protein KF685_08820 [Acidobacteria bacterium]|nr:hypothetical protein [Acidobacteriota bacterium]